MIDAYNNEDAVSNNGFRSKDGYFYPDQPDFDFEDIDDDSDEEDTEGSDSDDDSDADLKGALAIIGIVAIGYGVYKGGKFLVSKVKGLFENKQRNIIKTTDTDYEELNIKSALDLNSLRMELETSFAEMERNSTSESEKHFIKAMYYISLAAEEINESTLKAVKENDSQFETQWERIYRLASSKKAQEYLEKCLNNNDLVNDEMMKQYVKQLEEKPIQFEVFETSDLGKILSDSKMEKTSQQLPLKKN